MKKITFLKTLLVAVGLCAWSSSAWADDINISPSEVTQIWASGNTENTDYGDQNFYDADATSWTCTQANISNGKLNNQNAGYGGSYAVIVKFDGSTQLAGMNVTKATLKFNSVCTVSGKNSNVIVSSLGTNWEASTVTWNNLDRTVTQISAGTGQNVKTSTLLLSEDVTDLLSADEDKVVAFAIYTYTAREQKITNLVLEVEAFDASSSANVTLKYVDGSANEIKSETIIGNTGSTLTLSEENKKAFFKDDKKYFYVSDNSADVTVASDGSSVVTITCREAEVYNYSLLDNFGNTVFAGTGMEGETIDVPYPRYALIDGVFYEAPKTNDNKKQYRINIKLTEDNATNTITYSEKAGEVVFFSEAENLTGVTVTTAGNQPIRASNGAGALTNSEIAITTLSAGKYIIHAGVFTSKSSYSGLSVNIGVGSATYIASCSGVNMTEQKSSEFNLTSATDIKFLGVTGDAQFDYIWIEKTGDVTEAIPGSNATGFLTFAADVALDFSATETKAYIATAVADNKVQLTQVTKVPAGTGLILERANGSTEAIPVLSGDADDVSANKLVRGTGATVENGYVLVNRAGTAEFAGIGTDKPVVAKNQAYLNIAAEAPYLQFVFAESETTGISTVKAAAVNGAIYNLNGQRVAKATKGLYIVNGKKAIIK